MIKVYRKKILNFFASHQVSYFHLLFSFNNIKLIYSMSRKYFILFLYILLLIKSEMKLTRTRYTNTCHCSKKQDLAMTNFKA